MPLRARFGTVHGRKRQRGYTSVTDGQMQSAATMNIEALVECKRSTRRESGIAVDRQEAAMMIAWIKEYPNAQRRILVSQDGPEISITFAICPPSWLDYITRHDPAPCGLMTLNRFGPWFMDHPDDTSYICAILLAISLE
ncbi:hypothetical protein BJX70DRAFT_179812 [Aspergillus crustosus]